MNLVSKAGTKYVMTKMRGAGIGLVVAAIALWAGWTSWFNSRTWCPVKNRLSLSNGEKTRTNEFRVNVSGTYQIEVEAGETDNLALEALSCSMGIGPMWPGEACSTPNILDLSWVLTADNRVIAHGKSADVPGGGTTNDTAIRTVGYFHGQKGQSYKLDISTLSDASSLAAANPQVQVALQSSAYEYMLFVGGVIKFASGILAALGLIMLVSSVKFGPRILK